MLPRPDLLTHWYYHLPDQIIAVLIYLLLVRLVLVLARFNDDGAGGLVRMLNRITNPVLAGVGAITPRAVPAAGVIVFALVWLMTVRLALFIGVTARGIRLTLG
jgi:hypothetical protein